MGWEQIINNPVDTCTHITHAHSLTLTAITQAYNSPDWCYRVLNMGPVLQDCCVSGLIAPSQSYA